VASGYMRARLRRGDSYLFGDRHLKGGWVLKKKEEGVSVRRVFPLVRKKKGGAENCTAFWYSF